MAGFYFLSYNRENKTFSFRMKILFVTRKYPPKTGGMERFSFNLTTRIHAETTIIALRKSQAHLIWFLPYAFIRTCFIARKYDVVHLGDALLAKIGFFVQKFTSTPIVCTVHGLDITYPFLPYQWYIRIFYKPDLSICVSRAAQKLLIKRGIKPSIVIPQGVDTDQFKKQGSRKEALSLIQSRTGFSITSQPVLLSVGRLVKRKGVMWFLEHVFLSLPKNTLYIIVGKGKLEQEIIDFIKFHNLQSRIFLFTDLRDQQLASCYKIASIFIMPNIPVPNDMEGFGIVALEAGSAGLPVIASDIEGISDAISHNKNGFLIKSQNADEYRKTIYSFLKHPLAARLLGKRAKQYNEIHFSWEVICNRYKHSFRALIDQNNHD